MVARCCGRRMVLCGGVILELDGIGCFGSIWWRKYFRALLERCVHPAGLSLKSEQANCLLAWTVSKCHRSVE